MLTTKLEYDACVCVCVCVGWAEHVGNNLCHCCCTTHSLWTCAPPSPHAALTTPICQGLATLTGRSQRVNIPAAWPTRVPGRLRSVAHSSNLLHRAPCVIPVPLLFPSPFPYCCFLGSPPKQTSSSQDLPLGETS